MNYLVTGGTGLIGRYTIENLLKRGGTVYALVRPSSKHKLDELRRELRVDEDRLVFLAGDLTRKNLGIKKKDIDKLRGKIEHLYHVAAVYDITADPEELKKANVDGTRQVVAVAEALQVKCLQYTSSLAVAGVYAGVFREDMFEEAGDIDANPYLWSKHHAEKVVRDTCKVPYRIYRPVAVVGHSKTGQIDKVDGPYFLFKGIQKLSRLWPKGVPFPTVASPRFNVVPVDYVADAMDHIAHQDGLDGGCFHLSQPDAETVGKIASIFMKTAGGPKKSYRSKVEPLKWLRSGPVEKLKKLSVMQWAGDKLLDALQFPRELLFAIDYDQQFDCQRTLDALQGTGISVPKLADYAPVLWGYWERELDPDRAS